MSLEAEVESRNRVYVERDALRAELTAVRAQLAETGRQRDACGAESVMLREALTSLDDELRERGYPANEAMRERTRAALSTPSESTKWLAEHNERIVAAAVAKVQEHTAAALEEAVAQVAEIDRLRMQLANVEAARLDADRVAEEHRVARDEARAEVERLKVEHATRLAKTTAPLIMQTGTLNAEVERQRTVIAGLVESVTPSFDELRLAAVAVREAEQRGDTTSLLLHGPALAELVLARFEDVKKREPGCQCHLEEGDSPCRVHDRVEVVKFEPKPIRLTYGALPTASMLHSRAFAQGRSATAVLGDLRRLVARGEMNVAASKLAEFGFAWAPAPQLPDAGLQEAIDDVAAAIGEEP